METPIHVFERISMMPIGIESWYGYTTEPEAFLVLYRCSCCSIEYSAIEPISAPSAPTAAS